MRLASGGALLALAILAGCRDSATVVRAPAGQIAITQVDYRLRPQAVRTRPGPVTLRVVNRGRLAHTLRLRRGATEWAAAPSLLPGARARARRRLAPGTYTMFCVIANHEELGMWGTVEVR
jgi:plastocyanin